MRRWADRCDPSVTPAIKQFRDYKMRLNEQKRDIIFNGGLSHLGRLEKYKKLKFMLLGCILTFLVYYMYLKSRLV